MEARLKRFQAEHRGLANNRPAFDAKRASDPAFAAEIEALYKYFVGTFRRYCGNCWHDAFIQLLTIKKMNSKSHFRVLAGTLLHDPVNRDVKYMLTPQRLADMGDDLALRHLANNPKAVEYFEKPLPENLDELIADYRKRHAEPTAAEAPAATASDPEQEAPKEASEDAKAAKPGRGGRRNAAAVEKAEESAAPAAAEAPAQASDDAEKAAATAATASDSEQAAGEKADDPAAAPASEEEAPKEASEDAKKNAEEYEEVPSGAR
ncbi:MAG: hypothetical protein K2G66_00255 [Alistipes sp.]|nr:hypothetical protein [Alistipes sp.]